MNAIRIRTHLESDTPHLPELKTLIGRAVEIVVLVEELASPLAPGHGNWDEVSQAVRALIADGDYDFDAVRQQDAIDLAHAEDHLP